MTNKITGYSNRPVQVGTDKSVSKARDAATSAPETVGTSAGSPVRITDQARLAALEQAVHSVPVVNEARVAAVRTAIEEGRYEVSPERIADKLLLQDRDLGAAEK